MNGRISSPSGKELSVEFTIRELPWSERKRLALKTLGICWGISLASIPLPPIHWVTVPGFFLFGIYLAVRKLREPRHFSEFHFACPECTNKVSVAPQVVRNPLEFVCPGCRYPLKLRH